jgi:hypothetical protein
MPANNKLHKFKTTFGKILEPFAIGLLALLFIIPTLTVLNLTPITRKLEELNVLGVTTKDDISIDLVEGSHDIFTNERLQRIDEYKTLYSAQLNKRAADSYSKPIIEIANNSADIKKVQFYGQTETSTNSNIYLIINNKSHKIQNDRGFTNPLEIELFPGEKQIFFLSIESLTGVQFNESFEMEIKTIQEL